MKKLFFLAMLIMLASANLFAQKYITKNGKVSFYSDGEIEKIQATNDQVSAAIDTSTGDFVVKILVKSFEFEKALMQEHFNDDYMESDKYPNSTFKGKITNLSDVNFSKDGTYNANIQGSLTIHGVTKSVTEKGTLQIKDGKIIGTSKFDVTLSDYNVKIPSVVSKNIAKTVQINVAFSMGAVKS